MMLSRILVTGWTMFTNRYKWAKAILEVNLQRTEKQVKGLQPALTSNFPARHDV
jgi:hypothetical protein